MSARLRILWLAMVSVHLAVVAVPCGGAAPPAAEAHRGAHPGHDAAAQAVTPHGPAQHPCHEEPAQRWNAVCPCGCGQAPPAGLSGHRLDPGLLAARPLPPAFSAVRAPSAPVPILPDVALDIPDPVPLAA